MVSVVRSDAPDRGQGGNPRAAITHRMRQMRSALRIGIAALAFVIAAACAPDASAGIAPAAASGAGHVERHRSQSDAAAPRATPHRHDRASRAGSDSRRQPHPSRPRNRPAARGTIAGSQRHRGGKTRTALSLLPAATNRRLRFPADRRSPTSADRGYPIRHGRSPFDGRGPPRGTRTYAADLPPRPGFQPVPPLERLLSLPFAAPSREVAVDPAPRSRSPPFHALPVDRSERTSRALVRGQASVFQPPRYGSTR